MSFEETVERTVHEGQPALRTPLRTAWTVSALIVATVLVLDPSNTGNVVARAATAFLGTLPYILFAVTLIAWLKSAGADAIIARAFEGREPVMIILAALFGGLAPFCSCEVIPFVAALLAFGTPLSAIMAFWLSSPLIDPPTLLITAGALGWKFAVAKAVGAVTLGMMGGFAILAATRAGAFAAPMRTDAPGGGCGCTPEIGGTSPHWRVWNEASRRSVFADEFMANGMFLAKWLVLAYLLEALLVEYVPPDWIGAVVGGEGIGPIVISALVGAPAYINSYVAPPLVAGLMEHGMGNGAAMAFVIAGSATCIPAMAAIWGLVNRAVFASYVALAIAGAILLGLAYQFVA